MPLKQDVCGLRGLQPRQVSSPRAWVWCREATSCHSHSRHPGLRAGHLWTALGQPGQGGGTWGHLACDDIKAGPVLLSVAG